MPQPPVVYLVDDDASIVRAVSRLLKFEGFETRAFLSPFDFLEGHDPSVSGCIILDVAMPGMTGLNLQQMVGPKAQPIIFISGESDIPESVAAMKAGAVDFLTKPFDENILISAVRSAVRHDAETRSRSRAEVEADLLFNTLTPREKQVFLLAIAGRLNKQIAADLKIGEKTVKVHRARLMHKMKARTVVQLINIANRLQLG